MTWKTIALPTDAGASATPDIQAVHKVALPVGNGNASGWVRFKIVSARQALERIRIDAFDAATPPKCLCSFEGLAPSHHFSCYLYLSPRVASVEIHATLVRGLSDDLVVTYRPIALIEYVWHSLRKGALTRFKKFLLYFHRPTEPFIISFEFPAPARFSGEKEIYQQWIESHEQALVSSFLLSVENAKEYPTISILMPVCDPQPQHLKDALDSVRAQTSPNWTLSIADDASENPEIRQILERAARKDSRIRVQYSARRGGISAATNMAFAQSTAAFVTCLDHDDLLAPEAIEACSRYLAAHPDCRLLTSDEDKVDAWGEIRSAPFFKPQRFSRELFYSSNYINHLTTHHADTVRKVGGWRSVYDGAQDYDLILRSLEVLNESSIHHIPLILYHWRMVVGSTALNIGYKPYAIKAGKLALTEHLKRSGIDADVTQVADATYRVRRALPRVLPKVSILIPFRDQADLLERCVASIFSMTSYKNFEVILVNNGSSDSSTLELIDRLKSTPNIRILDDDRPFNYSRLNNVAAVAADGEYLCLLNNDTEVIAEDWLDEMLSFACVPEIGCVGALLLYPNRTIQHAGVVLGMGGVAGHVFLRYGEGDPGYFGRLLAASNCSAVTGACMMLRRSTFFEVGGLDAQDLAVAFNDIDLCIKVQLHGYRNVITPFAKLIHLESATRGSDHTPDKIARFNREAKTMLQRYGDLLKNDPFYSPNLSLSAEAYSIRMD
ncbi:glycosyltransferase family 2 protein [Rhodoplanes sp. Z2-YC6860]|uniref:glycosyltransferase family 2 protein n=1 Tax=Rhodoplanes sp. Z2-YC6860 TaxID=674703 RepID=UPI00078DD010|nr:glycosyltransferase family 2 protein [Rhodoplanes sp. Z2-YC6860]AMN41333.1 Glycosyl transferase, group 2 family protein [Rhodoplanes sp. Z2-YC6860]